MSRNVTMRHSANAKAEEERLIAEMMAFDAQAEGETVSKEQPVQQEQVERFDPNQFTLDNTEVPTNVEPTVPTEQDTLNTQPQDTPEAVPPVPKEVNIDYKEKYLEYKGRCSTQKSKYDSNIVKERNQNKLLLEENAKLKGHIARLTESLQAAQASKVQDVFTPDVVDVLGDDATNAIRSTMQNLQSQVGELRTELAKRDADNSQRQAQTAAQHSYDTFLGRLESVVPQARQLNHDPKFIEWLQGYTDFGQKRQEVMISAQKIGDVERVASFFKGYLSTLTPAQSKPGPKPVTDSVTTRTGPTGTGTVAESNPAAQTRADWLTTTEIDKFGQDVAKGKYKGRESERLAMVKRIDDAYTAGTILIK